MSERDRERYAALATMAAEIATSVGDAIVIEDVAIVTRKKGRANFATAADHAAEEAILARLAAHDASIPVLAEESAHDEIRGLERLWVVDPIDGTLNFSRGLPFYCVAIGYVEDGRVRAAGIHAPRTGETFWAAEGSGARRNGIELRVSDVEKVSEAFTVTGLAYGAAGKKTSRFVMLNSTTVRLRVIGSAVLEICYVAAGRFDLFVHEALSPWDIAAPQLVAREAGAAVVSLETGTDARWDEGRVIIGNPALVKDAIAAVPLVRPKKK